MCARSQHGGRRFRNEFVNKRIFETLGGNCVSWVRSTVKNIFVNMYCWWKRGSLCVKRSSNCGNRFGLWAIMRRCLRAENWTLPVVSTIEKHLIQVTKCRFLQYLEPLGETQCGPPLNRPITPQSPPCHRAFCVRACSHRPLHALWPPWARSFCISPPPL